MPFSTSVCRTAAVRKVEGACRLSCSCGPGQWPGRDVDGQEKGAEGPSAFGSGGQNHPWAVAGPVVARTVCCQQSHPAHVVAGAGIVWRTSAHKGSPFLRRRAPAPNTADHEGSPGGSRNLANHQGTLRRGGKNADQQNAQEAVRGRATFRSRGRGRLGGTRTRTKKALRAGRPAGRAGHRPRRRWRARLTGNGVGQEPLRPLLRGREAPRLDVPVSTGSVPLQPG